jgi:SPP1 family phage portal protein
MKNAILEFLTQQRLLTPNEMMAQKIEYDSNKAQTDFLKSCLSSWLNSAKHKQMADGQRYYENSNDILTRKRTVIGRLGEMTPAPYLANNRLPHAFMRKLTKQKIGYLLANPFSILSNDEQFGQILNSFVDKTFYRLFKSVCKDAVVAGIGWLQVYYDENGELKFKRLPATEVIPFWADVDHTVLDAAIRVYDIEVYKGTEVTTQQHLQFFTKDAVFNYIKNEFGELVADENAPVEYNFKTQENDDTGVLNEQFNMWERIPLIPIKYNSEEDSLLNYIKPLIDDYDKRTSDLSNVIQDEPDKIKIVKNYDGTDKDEFTHNLAKYRTVFLRGDGDISSLDTSISVTAIESHINQLRKDIYEFGAGVDTQNTATGDKSGTALKFLYADLDMDCLDFAAELSWSLEQIGWFIVQDCILKGKGDFTAASVDVTFNTDITINEKETIENIKNSVGIISDETLLKNHPWVGNVAEEREKKT